MYYVQRFKYIYSDKILTLYDKNGDLKVIVMLCDAPVLLNLINSLRKKKQTTK